MSDILINPDLFMTRSRPSQYLSITGGWVGGKLVLAAVPVAPGSTEQMEEDVTGSTLLLVSCRCAEYYTNKYENV